jgi:hypothetical protein
MSMAFKAWTTVEEDRLLSSIRQQKPLPVIAREHNRSVKAIEMRAEGMIRRMHKEGRSPKELMSLFRRSEQDIDTILSAAAAAPSAADHRSNSTTTQIIEAIQGLESRLSQIEENINKLLRRQKSLNEKIDGLR